MGLRLALYFHMLVNIVIGSRLVAEYFIYRLGLRGRGPGFLSSWYMPIPFFLLPPLAASLGVYVLLSPIVTVFVALPASVAALLAWCWLFGTLTERLLHISMYDCGSARQLEGECLLFEYYWGEGWTPEERLHAAASLRTACEWMQEKAEWRGIDVHFIYAELAKDHSTDEAPDLFEAETPSKGKLELPTQRAHEHASRRRLHPDNFAIIVHVRQEEGGFALPAFNLRCSRFTEVGFCNYLDPRTYAHEILHLFGAYDLYLDGRSPSTKMLLCPERQRNYRGAMREIFQSEFSHSVMATRGLLEDLGVSNLTAHAVGWTQPWSARKRETARYLECVRRARELLIESAIEERWPQE